MDKNKVYIVGVLDSGADSLTPGALAVVNQAEVLIGGRRVIAFFPETKADRHFLGADLSAATQVIDANRGNRLVVVLASGDPGFYGIGRYLEQHLGREKIEIIPNLTSLQLAFARIKESWDDAVLVSAHGRPLAAVVAAAASHDKLGILTDRINTPAAIARGLIEAGLDRFHVFIAHNLGGPQEKVFRVTLPELTAIKVSEPNVMVLIARDNGHRDPAPVLGLPDDTFERTRPGMITKMEVRAISLAKLGLTPASVVWDIGAGSGAVAIEAARLCPRGTVYAIEKDPEATALITRNRDKFGAANLTVITGEAPEELAGLEDPDAIFIGGSGGRLEAIARTCIDKLKPGGRLVANMIVLEHLHTVQDLLRQANLPTDVTLVNISRGEAIGEATRFEALNPVFIVRAFKKNHV